MDHTDALGIAMKAHQTEKLLDVRGLSKSFRQRRPAGMFRQEGMQVQAVKSVSFTLTQGECLGLVGESGCGKSTIASLVAGFLAPDKGEILFKGERLASRGRRAQRQRRDIQMIFQNPFGSLNPYMNVGQNLREAVRYYCRDTEDSWRENASELLERMGLSASYLSRGIRELSGGECQRVAIARALMRRPELLICDEITSDLDVSVQAEIMKYLLTCKDDGISMLFITHDRILAGHICSRICVMENGAIAAEYSGKAMAEMLFGGSSLPAADL